MKAEVNITLTDYEEELLMNIFKCDDQELLIKLNGLATAAFEEYLRMVLGQKVFTRGKDIQEFRLYLLIKYFFKGAIPEEDVISRLFQITTGESKSLLRSVMAKYQYDLKMFVDETIKNILSNEVLYEEDNHLYYVSRISVNLKDEMNKILSSIDGSLKTIRKRRNVLQTYDISVSAYVKLCEHYNIKEKDDHLNE